MSSATPYVRPPTPHPRRGHADHLAVQRLPLPLRHLPLRPPPRLPLVQVQRHLQRVKERILTYGDKNRQQQKPYRRWASLTGAGEGGGRFELARLALLLVAAKPTCHPPRAR